MSHDISQTMTFKIPNSVAYQMLQDEQVEEFNAYRAAGHGVDIHGALLRGLDLRGLNAAGLDLTDCYFRGADLRGIDFREASLEGASFADAKISGCYFPSTFSPMEIRMAVDVGTRLRLGC